MIGAYHSWRTISSWLGSGRNGGFRRQAEKFWQTRQFSAAVRYYRLHLRRHPDDYGAWLDLGFCEAFAGRKNQADTAYARARMVAPQSADAFVKLAHQRAAGGRTLSAFAYYRQALLSAVRGALEAPNQSFPGNSYFENMPSGGLVHGRRIFLDISDILRYLRHNNHGTGIQRVVLSMTAAWFRKFRQQDVVFVFCRDGRSQIFAIADEDVAALVETTEDPTASASVYGPCIDKIYSEAPPARVSPGDAFVIIGAFWISIGYSLTLADLRARGVRVGAYIYDLIPLTHPEFVNQSELSGVLDRFGDVLTEVDFVCAISEFVAQEVRTFLNDRLGRSIPVAAVPLAHDPPPHGDGQIEEAFLKALPTEYALCICTIEGRKNHLLLFEVWRKLLAKYGEITPPLIVVGKWGWHGEAFKQKLEETQSLSGKIIVLGNQSDAKIDYLYRHCLFTVFPSFVEGWGLPVGESLACGTPCIASNASSIPEVGGDLVRYIDPNDVQNAFAVIENALVDRRGLLSWRAEIEATFQPRTWTQVVDHFLAQIELCARSVPSRALSTGQPLRAGQTYHFVRAHDDLENWNDRAHKFIFEDGWHSIESWGLWSSKPLASLSILTELSPGQQVCVRFLVRGAPPKKIAQIVLRDSQSESVISTAVSCDQAEWVEIKAVVDDSCRLKLTLQRVDTDFVQVEPERSLFLGLCAVILNAGQVNEIAIVPASGMPASS